LRKVARIRPPRTKKQYRCNYCRRNPRLPGTNWCSAVCREADDERCREPGCDNVRSVKSLVFCDEHYDRVKFQNLLLIKGRVWKP
jgi:hypothetical protein